jgi:hypothetical protein
MKNLNNSDKNVAQLFDIDFGEVFKCEGEYYILLYDDFTWECDGSKTFNKFIKALGKFKSGRFLAANLVSGQIRFFKITEFVEKVNMGFKFV